MNVHVLDDRYKSLILRASLTHLNVIARSSFHQTRYTVSPTITSPTSEQAYTLRDHANYHFLDRALVAFELYENPAKELKDIRKVFPRMWDNNLWSVWWWANSEDKARAKMERWRQESPSARARRRAF